MSRSKQAVKSAARRARSVLGVSLPGIEAGVATGGGILAANWITGKIIDSVNQPQLREWYGVVALKLGVGVALRMLIGLVSRKWGNAALGGAIASAVLTVVKKWSGTATWDTRWGLAGDELDGLINSSDVTSQYLALPPGGFAGVMDEADLYTTAFRN